MDITSEKKTSNPLATEEYFSKMYVHVCTNKNIYAYYIYTCRVTMVHFNLPVLFFKAVINFNGLTGQHPSQHPVSTRNFRRPIHSQTWFLAHCQRCVFLSPPGSPLPEPWNQTTNNPKNYRMNHVGLIGCLVGSLSQQQKHVRFSQSNF